MLIISAGVIVFLTIILSILIFIVIMSKHRSLAIVSTQTDFPSSVSQSQITSTDKPNPSETPFHVETSTPIPTASVSPIPIDTVTPTPSPDPWVENTLRGMSLDRRIGQTLMIAIDGLSAEEVCPQLQSIAPGGIIYLPDDAQSPDVLRNVSHGIQECLASAGIPPALIAIDHEGQFVNRFQGGVTNFPAQMALGAGDNPELARRMAVAAGSELAYSGINLVLGPVADVLLDPDSIVISQRSFGNDPSRVASLVAAYVKGYQQVGLLSALKHFPGHGGVSDDSHYELPLDDTSIENLRKVYLPSFSSGIEAGAQVVMLGHVAFTSLDPEGSPASLSDEVVDLLRVDLGFTGFILTDSLGMGAITSQTGNLMEASWQALLSGADMLMVTRLNLVQPTIDRIQMAVEKGELSQSRLEEAVRQILQVKSQNGLTTLPALPSSPDWEANRDVARQAGKQAITLLRNQENLIPLPLEIGSVLLIGPP